MYFGTCGTEERWLYLRRKELAVSSVANGNSPLDVMTVEDLHCMSHPAAVTALPLPYRHSTNTSSSQWHSLCTAFIIFHRMAGWPSCVIPMYTYVRGTMTIVKVFVKLFMSYLLQRRAGVYFGFEGHDLSPSGFTSSGLVLTSVKPLLIWFSISKDKRQSCSYSRNNAMSSEMSIVGKNLAMDVLHSKRMQFFYLILDEKS